MKECIKLAAKMKILEFHRLCLIVLSYPMDNSEWRVYTNLDSKLYLKLKAYKIWQTVSHLVIYTLQLIS